MPDNTEYQQTPAALYVAHRPPATDGLGNLQARRCPYRGLIIIRLRMAGPAHDETSRRDHPLSAWRGSPPYLVMRHR